MSTDLLKYAFVAGELSPSLLGRTDMTKYDLAMAEAYNFFVDYRGGLSSRPGLEFVDFLPDYDESSNFGPDLAAVESPFIYAMKIEAEEEYNYIIVVSPVAVGGRFDHSIIRFYQNGRPDIETTFNVNSVSGTGAILFNVPGHNYANGDWVQFNDYMYNFQAPELAGTSFIVQNVSGANFNLAYVSTGNLVQASEVPHMADLPFSRIGRIYTLTCDYQPQDYAKMYWQPAGSLNEGREANCIRITHPNYPTRNLIWYFNNGLAHTPYDQFTRAWVLSNEVIGIDNIGPTITSSTASATGQAAVVFAVSAVYENDIESVRGPAYKISNIVNYTATAGSVSIYWSPDPNALYYNVYRSIVSVTEVLTSGVELGFVGRTKGTKFTDPNIIPDFSRTPTKHKNPFAHNRVVYIQVGSGGTGYTDFATTITLTGSIGGLAAGFFAEAVVDPGTGAIVNTNIINEGHDYNMPPTSTLTITGTGTGAALTLFNEDSIGEAQVYPAVSVVYQQRQLYAATSARPVTIWGSQVGLLSNFNTSDNVVDSDSFEFDLNIDTFNYAPIRHLIATQAGLIAMTQESIWVLNGGSAIAPLTATNIVASPQNFTGVSQLRPLKVGGDIVFVEGKGYAVRVLSYNEIYRNFAADDKSILSSHLFGRGKELISWAYQEQPSKIIWGVKSDGDLVAFTLVKSEDVYAWCSGGTKGQFLAVANMRENLMDTSALPRDFNFVDSVYFITQRYIQGRWRRMIERMVQRNFVNIEDSFCLDAAVRSNKLDYQFYNCSLQKLADGNWQATFSSSTMNPGDVLRAAGGVFSYVSNISSNVYEVAEIEPPKSFIPETNNTMVPTQKTCDWSISTPSTTVYGLWHLNGETVSILADGKIVDPQVVVNGTVTLPFAASRVVTGIPFTARARSLPVSAQGAIIEGKRKRIVGMGVRLQNTKGLEAGRNENELYDVERGGAPTVMKDGVHHEMLSTHWEDDASITFVQNKPLPVTMLSLISDVEVGDDSD